MKQELYMFSGVARWGGVPEILGERGGVGIFISNP